MEKARRAKEAPEVIGSVGTLVMKELQTKKRNYERLILSLNASDVRVGTMVASQQI